METSVLVFIAHTLIGFYFIFFGVWNIYHWRFNMEMLIQKNFPHPWLLLSIEIVWQILFGFMIMLNFYIGFAAGFLIPLVVLTTFIYYPFWKTQGEQRKLHFILAFTNITMVLSTLLLLISSILA